MQDVVVNINQFYTVLILLACSLVLRGLLIRVGQNWLNTLTLTLTFLILPVITYVITSVISGNIALSLGMVGALSIIRFRNPVKSPLELTVYFLLITNGIAASVNYQWTLILTAAACSIVVVVAVFERFYKDRYGCSYFRASFSEGNALHTLEIQSKNKLPELINNPLLLSFFEGDSQSVYRFASASRQDLITLSNEINEMGLEIDISFQSA